MGYLLACLRFDPAHANNLKDSLKGFAGTFLDYDFLLQSKF